jgi:hypothetical protein
MSCFRFGKYALTVYNNIKDTIDSRNQLNFSIENPVQFSRQTGSLRFIVSWLAIKYINLHHTTPF